MTNKWDQPVRIYWLDYEGKRKPWSDTTVQPGGIRTCHQTYEGHAWLFTDKTGKALGIYTLGPKTAAIQFAGPVK